MELLTNIQKIISTIKIRRLAIFISVGYITLIVCFYFFVTKIFEESLLRVVIKTKYRAG